MSTDSSRSSRNGGSGTIISSTTAMTAAGASRCAARCGRGAASVVVAMGLMGLEDQLLEAHEVREHLGDRAEERRGNRVADFGAGVQRARERDVLDDRHAVIPRDLPDARGHQ